MKIDKGNFFKIIDSGDHLNSRTREAYWDFFSGECQGDIITLYNKGDQVFPDSAVHAYVKNAIDKKINLHEGEVSDIIKPIESSFDKKIADSWGRNDDVRGK